MSNQLQIFNSPKFGQVRTIEVNGKTYFVGSDVAKALGYAIPHKAINTHCRGVLKWNIPHPQNLDKEIEVLVIPEGDIYRLAAKSELPGAEEFESWVFDEVVPSIRKTGVYAITTHEGLSPQLQALALLTQQAIDVEKKISIVQQEVSNVESRLSKSIEILTEKVEKDWKDKINAKINEICARCSFSYQAFRGDLYAELEQAASCNLNTRQKHMRERMGKAGATYKERQAVTKIHVIESDNALKQIFETIVNRYVLKYSD